ncbi:hypothetical protein HOLleu_38042 [Holothuria leucospilota]|uniref:CCHC-type domain-containing protein n=1 Tax=Holothuria leucospilota TaxID=206669 RepID=A0A9Q0YIV0_HOLLE|nr:hypothetical protein HOLleu_38042 [Holothuria leucospilota]
MDEELIPTIPTQSDDEDFQLVSRNKRRKTAPDSPEPAKKEPTHHCQFPVILTGLPPDLRNPIEIRRYLEECHPSAQVIGIKTSRKGLTIIAAQNPASQKTLLGQWKPIRGRTPTPRLPKEKKDKAEETEGVIVGLHPEVTEEDLAAELSGNTNGFTLCSFRRFFRKGTKTPTWKAAVRFRTPEELDRAVTKGVFIGYQHHRVEKLRSTPSPIQCHNCQRFGHYAGNCQHQKTCLRCAGHHALADCTTPRDQPRCANCRRSHIASFKGCSKYQRAIDESTKKNQPPKTPRAPPAPTRPQTTSNDSSFCSPQILDDLQRKHEEAITKMEERHQLQLEALKLQHQVTMERVEEANSQLFHQMREETITQLHKLKGQLTHFLGDVLTCLIPEKGDNPPSDYRKATVIKEKAWKHLGLSIEIPAIKEGLQQKTTAQKTTSR